MSLALAPIEAFVGVVDTGSFRGAAKRLGISPSAVSKNVGRLEDELGVTLLTRTTRSVRLTPEGTRFVEHARAALDELAAGVEQVARIRDAPRGVVRISVPLVLADAVVAALPRLHQRHPLLRVELSATDRHVRVVEEGYDVVVRIGELVDSTLVGRRLRGSHWFTVGSPAYLAQRGSPARPDDLTDHACLVFARPQGGITPWRYREGDAIRTVRPPERLRMDHGPLLVDAAKAGMGLTQAFDFMVEGALARGELVQVLEPYVAAAPPVHALCPSGHQKVPRVRAVLDLLATSLRT